MSEHKVTPLQRELGNHFCELSACFEDGASIADVEAMLDSMRDVVEKNSGADSFREPLKLAAVGLSMLQVGIQRFAARNGYELL